ncbi:hypothetical protein [Luteolibacter marinus]|uniref:hypothetical protein n=1 Tax=Luteolibacter marinus TaxID=2776705 RepID=UPI001867EFC9|nr:hypothetical protein [Luteolibacter marinus]
MMYLEHPVVWLSTAIAILLGYVVLRFVIHPLSYVYRPQPRGLAIRSFGFLKRADLPYDGIKRLEPLHRRDLARRHFEAPVEFLTGGGPLAPGTLLLWETDAAVFVLPGWHYRWLGAQDREVAYRDAIRERRKKWLTTLWLGVQAAVRITARFVRIGTFCLMVLPLWTLAIQLTGIHRVAENLAMPVMPVFRSLLFPDFAATLFPVACGVMIMIVLAGKHRIPLAIGGITLVAACSRFFFSVGHAHDISHQLFDNCIGFDRILTWSHLSILASAISVACASLVPYLPSRRGAGTP